MVLTVILQEIVRGGLDDHGHTLQVLVSPVVEDCQIKSLGCRTSPELDLSRHHRGVFQ